MNLAFYVSLIKLVNIPMYKNVFRLMVLSVCLASGSWTHGETVTWVGSAGDGSWGTAANWSSGTVPTSAQDVSIQTGTVSTGTTTNPRAKILTFGGDATFNVQKGFDDFLTKFVMNAGTVNWSSGDRIYKKSGGVGTSDDYVFEMHGGTFKAATNFATLNGGKFLFDGGLFRVTNGDGTLILGLEGDAKTTIQGNVQIDAPKISIGARLKESYTSKNSTVDVSGNALILVRGGTGSTFTSGGNGLLIGVGDNSGNGTLNQSGGTINVLSGADVHVGSSKDAGRNTIGKLAISGGELNAARTIYVGKYSSSTTGSQTGTLELSGTGTLRAGTIQPGLANATMTFSGGTLAVGTYKGNFVNAGTTIAPETWELKKSTDSTKTGTAGEYAYTQSSVFGTTTIEGTYAQNSGSVAIDLGDGKCDQIKATSFNFTGGSVSVNWNGTYKAPGTDGLSYQFFVPTDSAATNTWLNSLTYDSTISGWYDPVYDSATGKLTLTQRVEGSKNVAGNWNATATWASGILPNEHTNVEIKQGTITVPTNENVKAQTITIDGGKLVVAANGFDQSTFQKFVMKSGSVEYNSEKRFIQNSANFEMSGGTFTTSSRFPTMNGGTFTYTGGLFRVTMASGTVLWGLDQNATTYVSGSAQIDAPNVTLGARYGGNYTSRKSTLNLSGGTMLVRGGKGNEMSTAPVGLVIGSGDGDGNATVNQTGGTINVLSAGGVYVGSATVTGRNSIGELNISAGELNAAGTVYVGKYSSATTGNQTGTLKLSGTGILRAGKIQPDATKATMSFTGGTLAVGTYEGDFVNAGSTIAPETWTFTKSTEKANASSAQEWAYSQTSKTGTMKVNGDFMQTSGTIQLDLAADGTSDLVLADSFDLTGGTLSLDFVGEYDGSKNVYTLFGLNDSATGTIDLSKLEVQMSESLKSTPYLIGSNGQFMLGYTANDVPEPASWLLLVLGIRGIWGFKSRKWSV